MPVFGEQARTRWFSAAFLGALVAAVMMTGMSRPAEAEWGYNSYSPYRPYYRPSYRPVWSRCGAGFVMVPRTYNQKMGRYLPAHCVRKWAR